MVTVVFSKKLDYTTTVKINGTRVSSSQRREIKSSTEARHEAARATAHQTGCGTGRRTHARAQCAHPATHTSARGLAALRSRKCACARAVRSERSLCTTIFSFIFYFYYAAPHIAVQVNSHSKNTSIFSLCYLI